MRRITLRKLGLCSAGLAAVLIVGVVYGPLLVEASANATINFGETLAAAISVVGEVDAFTFSASAGDIVLARMTETSGTLDPLISIQDEGGNTLCSTSTYANPTEIKTCTLPQTGTYTLYAEDNDATDTGNYQIYLQRLNNPGNTSSIAYGDTLSSAIAGAAELDTYTFDGTSGDLLVARMTRTSVGMRPQVRVYAPNGSLLCGNYQNESAFVADCALPDDGIYTLLVGDYMGENTGTYNVHIQKLNEPAGSASLPVGQVTQGTLVAAAEMKAYTLHGDVGDSFIFRMEATSAGGLVPQLTLYSPAGVKVCSDYGYSFYPMAEILNCQVAEEGEHTLLVSDYTGGKVGNYDLYLARISAPVSSRSLPYAKTQIDTTSSAAQLHLYTFVGQANDVVVAQLAVPAQSFSAQVRLYLENGSLICEDYSHANVFNSAAWIHCILPQDATYVIAVGSYADNSYRGPGTYQLFLQRLTPAVAASRLGFGESRAASIVPEGEIDTYTFQAASGDVVTVKMHAGMGTIDPYIHLYGTDGVKLDDAYYRTYNDGEAVIASCTLPFSGTYTLLASDYGGTKAGNYTLSLLCDGESCGIPLVLDEGVFLPIVLRQ